MGEFTVLESEGALLPFDRRRFNRFDGRVVMNGAIEIHDSNLAGVEPVGRDAVLHLNPAYVHRSEGRPGIDPGSGWLQDFDLVVSGAVIESLPEGLPAALADGVLSVDGTAWVNSIPLPLAVSGIVQLSMKTSRGEQVLVRGSGVAVVSRGEPRFIESFPGTAGE